MLPVIAGLGIAIVALVLAVAIGAWRARPGRFRAPPRQSASSPVVGDTPLAGGLGSRATLLQFSSVACAPCRAAGRILQEVAATTPGVQHVELDAAEHLDLVERIDIRRTPTTLILDPAGRELGRVVGVPSPDVVRQGLPGRAGVGDR